MGKAFIDRTGLRYGSLTARRYLGKPPGSSKNKWECVCDCGNVTQVSSSNLSTGHTLSCGCLLIKEMVSRRKYPKELAAEYSIWRGIKQRVSDTTSKNAAWYTHVSLDESWENSFETFVADMGKRPSPKHSIERINGKLGYSKGNCVWATPTVQANNRSTNRNLTLNGVTLTAAQWSRALGIKQHTILARIDKYGWSVEDALTQSKGTRNVLTK